MFAKQKSEHFDVLEAGHFHAILVSDSLQTCTVALKHARVIVDDIFSYSSLRRYLSLYTLLYRPPGVKKLLDLHPDFIKHAVSEQFLWLGLNIGLLFQTPLAASSSSSSAQPPPPPAPVTPPTRRPRSPSLEHHVELDPESV